MLIRTRKTPHSTVVGVSESVARADLPRLSRALKKSIEGEGTRVVIDIRKAEDVDLAFVQVLVSATKTAVLSSQELWVKADEEGRLRAMVDALGLGETIAFWSDEDKEGRVDD